MALLPNTGLETHPAGTTNVGGIINANWTALDALHDPALGGGDPMHNAFAKAIARSATLPTGPATLEWGTTKPVWRPHLASVAYAGTVDLPATGPQNTLIALTGDITITLSALAAGREFSVIMQADASTRAITWPASIVWLGATPANVPAGKTLRVHFLSTGTTAAGVLATPAAQP